MGHEAHRSVPGSIQSSPARTNPLPEAARGNLSSSELSPAIRAANARVVVTIATGPSTDLIPTPPSKEALNAIDIAIKREEASTILHGAYSPDVADKLQVAFEPFAGMSDEDLRNHCDDTTDAVHTATGFKTVYGYFVTDLPLEDTTRKAVHAWNEDPDSRIIEYSGRQFNSHLQPSNQITSPVQIIDADHPLRSRYIPLDPE